MAARKTPNNTPKRNAENRPARIGKVRDGQTGRGWQAKLYGPTSSYVAYRVSFKEASTGLWVNRRVPKGVDPDDHFDELESDLDKKVVQHSVASGERPTMRDLADRHVDYLRSKKRDAAYIRNVMNLLKVWVLSTDADLYVQNWSSEHSVEWIGRIRAAGLSAARVENLGTVLSGMRKTAHRKGKGGTRWLNPSDNPMEDVEYSRRSTERGTHRDYVQPSDRPSTDHLRSLIAEAELDGRWSWLPIQMGVGGCCGPRLAEQMGLRDVDVDFVKHELRIWTTIRWPVPSEDILVGLDLTKTKERRSVPYPKFLHKPLLALCRASLGLDAAATVAEVTEAQDTLYAKHLEELDRHVMKTQRARPISPHDHLLFIDDTTGVPPTKEAYGMEFRKLRARSTWPPNIPWRNARHHAAMWWRATMITNGAPVEYTQVAAWLGNSLTTCQNHYCRNGEDSAIEARRFLDKCTTL